MGHFNRRPDPEGRPGQDNRKITKEMKHGRLPAKSHHLHKIRELKRRLDGLEDEISRVTNPYQREHLSQQYANLAACCPPEVFTPSEIRGIVRHSELSDSGLVENIERGMFPGKRPDFLPLHHFVKILTKVPYGEPSGDYYISLLGKTSRQATPDLVQRNHQALEYCLLAYASLVPKGKNFDVVIDGNRVQIPWHSDEYRSDDCPIVGLVRGRLAHSGIGLSACYTIRKIRDGSQKIVTTLYVVTEKREVREDAGSRACLVSYLTHVKPRLA
jgi:hypothetical protein